MSQKCSSCGDELAAVEAQLQTSDEICLEVMRERDAAKAEIETLRKSALGPIKNELIEKLIHDNLRLREALQCYGTCDDTCARSGWEAGEPTANGYRVKIKGKWYQSKPIDMTPKCDCGLKSALDGGKP